MTDDDVTASGGDGEAEAETDATDPADVDGAGEPDSDDEATTAADLEDGAEVGDGAEIEDGAAVDDTDEAVGGSDGDDREEDGDDDSAADAADGSILSEFDVATPDQEGDDAEDEPVELLVQLADDGEIDPWDIDVVTVTDKFLARLDESDLRTGGRALFYASVLLRMKSDALWVDGEPDEDEWAEEPWEVPPPEEGGPVVDPFESLEREIDRRIERKRARGMPETLDELVRELRDRERDTWWKSSRTYDTSESPSGFARGTQTLDYHGHDDLRMDDEPTAADVTGTAHDEHMEDIINAVYLELQRHYDQGRSEVLFAEVRESGGSVVDTFLGVLFLSHRGQIRLQQDELFGDLWIQDPAAVTVEEPATADD